MRSPISTTAARVSSHTADAINARIRRQTQANIQMAASEGPEGIARRLEELDHEWDVERCLETGASSLVILGLTLAATVNRRWLYLSGGVAGFLLQHALQGWCPPLPVFRRLGVRTADEINQERYALKALRGDFAPVQGTSDASAAASATGLRG